MGGDFSAFIAFDRQNISVSNRLSGQFAKGLLRRVQNVRLNGDTVPFSKSCRGGFAKDFKASK